MKDFLFAAGVMSLVLIFPEQAITGALERPTVLTEEQATVAATKWCSEIDATPDLACSVKDRVVRISYPTQGFAWTGMDPMWNACLPLRFAFLSERSDLALSVES